MITIVCVTVYALAGWQLAPRFARWAKNQRISDPAQYGLLMTAVWPMCVAMFAFAWSFSLAARIVAARAGLGDEVQP